MDTYRNVPSISMICGKRGETPWKKWCSSRTGLACRFLRRAALPRLRGPRRAAARQLLPGAGGSARRQQFPGARVDVCGKCFLVQLPEEERPEAIFSDYADLLLLRELAGAAEAYAAAMVERFGLGAGHRVVEVASNDGYLLLFVEEGDSRSRVSSRRAMWRRSAEGRGIPPGEVFR